MKTCKMNHNYVHQLGSILNNVVYPLKQRFRALFTLKNFGDDLSVHCICECFNDSSALLKHELAYCLGQMGNVSAIPHLIEVLEDDNQEVVVRHEAAEALGAIGHNSVVEVLKKYRQCGVQEIAETCELSLGRLNYFAQGGQAYTNVYGSIDPTPASEETDIHVLENVYVNECTDMFDRYRAMFTLRNMNSEESIRILTKGFSFKSVLFRHEVAFVLGQLQNPISIPDLKKAVENEHENNMVRHEAIEALGAIGKPECFEIIKSYVKDDDALVRESCEVALDIHTYQNSSEFQYANGLEFINCIG